MDPHSIRSEFRKFGETVSVRGVPRIFKSQATFVRVCWLIAVLASSALLFWQLSAVFIKYYSYPVSTSFEEGRDLPVFPDVTVCNLNPEAVDEELRKSTIKYNFSSVIGNMIDTNVTMDDILNYYWRYNFKNKTLQNILSIFKSEILTPSAYMANFPMDVGSSNQRLIVKYDYYGWDWTDIQKDELESFWSAEYFRCYTLRILDREKSKTIQAMNIILYINDFVNSVDKGGYYNPDIKQSQATGVRLVVHPSGTIPILSSGISIGPGTETTIKVDSTQRTRLHYPYSQTDCTDQEFLPYSKVNLYGYDNCQSVCLQQQVVDSCHCLYSGLRYTDQQVQQTNSTVCGNVSWIGEVNLPKAIKDFQCIYNLNLDLDTCNQICLFPCKETYYEYGGDTAPWPQIQQHLPFYNSYIRYGGDIIDVDKFKAYEDIFPLENDTVIIDRLRNLHLIQDNFLSVNVVMKSRYVYLMTDKALMTWEAMLSSIGGCLSLWLGVTVMTLVEVAEFLFSLCVLLRSNKNTAKINQ